MKESIAALSTDKRLQLILIAFCFGAFLEGTGGGGAPVAIAGSFLIGLGFEPFQAATLCLIANTAPVAWGAVGNPIRIAGDRHRAARAGPERHDRANPAAALGDPAALAGPQHGRLARDPARSGRPWPSAASRSRGCSSTGRTTRNPGWSTSSPPCSRSLAMVAFLKVWQPRTILENPAGPDEAEAGDLAPRRHDPAPLDLDGAQGMVAVPAGLGVHLRLGQPQIASYLNARRLEAADAVLASRGPAHAAGRPRARARGRDRRPECRLAARHGRLPGRGPGGADPAA